jgi:energy-coupling factor transporter ATP-binding protein EcfA2
MHISHMAIRNFRAISDIDFDLSARMNVIVGPNAVGKTTILQAARLVKGLIAPRTQSEAQQVLISLGAASPHFPQRVFLNSLARELIKPVEVRCTFSLTDLEIALLRGSQFEFVQNLVSARLGQGFSNPTTLLQFLQSPQGQAAHSAAMAEVSDALVRLERDKSVVVGVSMHASSGQIIPSDPLGGPMIAFLDQRLPPSLSFFSYFPADRALPMGEINMQIGGPDIQQQLESHNSQPQLKYQRLKHLIINSIVISGPDTRTIHEDFEKIFSGLLRGRRIKFIRPNELGLLSIMTEEIATGRLIELDGLSSGEKNIALTFLLIARSVAEGGIALFDEPELHLNPAVSRDLLPFIMEEYSQARHIQFIMCTHSPEVLSGAFKDEDCNLLHLKSADDITRIGKRAIEEYSEALLRLGTSVSETLFYEGTVFVEGDEDVAFLEVGFPDLLKKYQIKDRGGRREIEKAIIGLQALEQKGEKVSPIFLIFDKDEEPTGLQSSNAVRILQWPRRCIENYMLDLDVISDLLKDPNVTKSPIESEGEVHKILRDLAYKQLEATAAREIYISYGYLNASPTKEDIASNELPIIAQSLFERMSKARLSIPEIDSAAWILKFTEEVEVQKQKLLLSWEAKWKELCDGKKLIKALYMVSNPKISEAAFKERIVRKMRDTSSDNWVVVKNMLETLLARQT